MMSHGLVENPLDSAVTSTYYDSHIVALLCKFIGMIEASCSLSCTVHVNNKETGEFIVVPKSHIFRLCANQLLASKIATLAVDKQKVIVFIDVVFHFLFSQLSLDGRSDG